MPWSDKDVLTPQALNSRSGLVFNVREPAFGATGDGSTDDTTAIRLAITAARAVDGIVYFPPGTYIIDDTTTSSHAGLLIGANSQSIHLLGAGTQSTVLKLKDNSIAAAALRPAVEISTTDGSVLSASIQDLTIDANATNNTGAGVSPGLQLHVESGTKTMSDVLIRNVHIIDCNNGDGIITRNDTTGGASNRLTRIWLEGCHIDNPATNRNGIAIIGGSRIIIKGNFLTNQAGTNVAIDIEPNDNQPVDDVIVVGNIVADGERGFSATARTGSPVTNIVVSGNVFNVDTTGLLFQSNNSVAMSGMIGSNSYGSATTKISLSGNATVTMDTSMVGKLIVGEGVEEDSDVNIVGLTANGGGQLGLFSTTSGTADNLGRINFGNPTDSSVAAIFGIADGAADAGALRFLTEAIGASIEEAMRIDSLGRVLLTATTAARATFRLPHGTAPSSPVNGDIWTTTAGLFVRVNGGTVGPLTA